MDDKTDAQRDSSLIPQPSSLSTRRFRPYPEYQNSGAEWIREIPSHWSTKRLKNLVLFQGGGTPSKENLEYWSGNIPWVSPKDMKARFILDTADKITVEAVEQSATNLVDPGAVLLVVRSGILNHSIPVAIAGTTVALNQDLKALIPGAEVLPKYLSYVIDGKQSPLLVEWRKEGATVESLELDLIENSRFPLPPKSEQHAITEFLDRETGKIDALVAKKEQLIELLQEKRTALITQAVTKGYDPDVPMRGSGVAWLGEIPAHWTIIRLKFLAADPLKYGANEAAELNDPDLPRYIRITDIREDGSLREDTFRSLPEEVATPYLLKQGDLLFARSGATVGKTFRYDMSWGRAAYAGYLIRARLKESAMDSLFASYFAQSTSYWDWLQSSFIQATIQNVSAERYANLVVPVPPIIEQRTIVDWINVQTYSIDRLIAKIRDGIARLKEFRTALISAAVTGKIDVREEVA